MAPPTVALFIWASWDLLDLSFGAFQKPKKLAKTKSQKLLKVSLFGGFFGSWELFGFWKVAKAEIQKLLGS